MAPIFKMNSGPGPVVGNCGPRRQAGARRQDRAHDRAFRFQPARARRFQHRVRPRIITGGSEQWMQARDLKLAVGWRATSDTLWYYWRRYGRLVGYDIATRRCIGSLGPNGFARDLSGGGDRFSDSTERRGFANPPHRDHPLPGGPREAGDSGRCSPRRATTRFSRPPKSVWMATTGNTRRWSQNGLSIC